VGEPRQGRGAAHPAVLAREWLQRAERLLEEVRRKKAPEVGREAEEGEKGGSHSLSSRRGSSRDRCGLRSHRHPPREVLMPRRRGSCPRFSSLEPRPRQIPEARNPFVSRARRHGRGLRAPAWLAPLLLLLLAARLGPPRVTQSR